MNAIVRCQRSYFRIGVVGLIFVTAILVLFVLGPSGERPPGQSGPSFSFMVLVLSPMIVAGAFLVLTSLRQSVTLADEAVTITGILRERTIPLSAITRAAWKTTALTLELTQAEGTRRIHFANYQENRRPELIQYFRDRLPLEFQTGWNEAWEREADPEVVVQRLRSHGPDLRTLVRTALIVGPILGLTCGAGLEFCGAVSPTWTGSPLLDWFGRGALVGLGMGALLAGFGWMTKPDQPESA